MTTNVTRREWLGGALGFALTALPTRAANAAQSDAPARPPVLYVSHGAPIFAVNDPARIAELHAWGARLAKPRGILAMTPHWGSIGTELGATGGRGVALYNLPEPLRSRVPVGLEYPTPPNDDLALRVVHQLHPTEDNVKIVNRGFDHTTWMPLRCLFPAADIPVIELSYPYVPERVAFEFGQALAPLRDEGILFMASGGMTHNLAAMEPGAPPPSWGREFDQWAGDRVTALDVDALIDWRSKAPAANLAHPDDGGHYRVLLIALGWALGSGGAPKVTFPVSGFEARMSKRSIDFA
jgi:4,5-DOPA dioxygenase extradiol